MTIHAGEKAARLRRATASSSTSVTPISPLHSTHDGHQLPVPPTTTPIADTDILGVAEPSPILPRTTSLPSFRSRRSQSISSSLKQIPPRHRGGLKQVQPASSSTLQAITSNFVFSGVDPPPSQATPVATLDWNRYNVHQPTSIDSRSFPSTVFFVEPAYKEASKNASLQRTEIEMPSGEVQSPSHIKSSPRRYLPWFFAITASPTQSPNTATLEEEEAVDTSTVRDKESEGCKEEDAKKTPKKKKKKRKGKSKADPGEEEKDMKAEASADDGVDCFLKHSSLPTSDEPESETATAHANEEPKANSTAESTSTALEELHQDKDKILAVQDPTVRHEASQTRANRPRALSSASSSSLTLGSGFVTVSTRRNARRTHRRVKEGISVDSKRGAEPKEISMGLQVHAINSEEVEAVGHARKVSKTETETSYHTASVHASLPPSPGLQTQESEQMANEALISQFEVEVDKLASSTMSTRTEGSHALSTGETKSSVQSSHTEEIQAATPSLAARGAEVRFEQDEGASFVAPALLEHAVGHIESMLQPSCKDLRGQVDQVYEVKAVREMDEKESERLQRTLDWRLLSAGSSSPSSQLSSQIVHAADTAVPPKLKLQIPSPDLSMSRRESQQSALSATSTASRSQLALHLRRHQQRRLNYAWVQLLPSFEEVFPHRSAARETQLRRMSWLGLEEYVARKVRTTTAKGIKETVVWITHLCPGRSSMKHRSKVSPMEPLLCSSSVWLRATSKTNGPRKMEDAVRAYRTKLLQERTQDNDSVPLAVAILDRTKGNVLEWPLSTPPLLPTQSPLGLPYEITTGRRDHVHDSSASDSSNIDLENSLDLQRDIENCMYELRSCTLTPTAASAWLQTLDSIEQTEKEAMEAFFYNSSLDWHTSVDEGTAAADVHQASVETWPYAEPGWPTTPYASLPAPSLITSTIANEDGLPPGQGLSSCEMAEIEDAMFRDYLHQTNQMGSTNPRNNNNRRKDRNVPHGRGANASQGQRSRAPSSCSHASIGISEGQVRSTSSFSPVRTRSQEGRQVNALQSVTEKRAQGGNAFTTRLDMPSTIGERHFDALLQNETASVPLQKSPHPRAREQQQQQVHEGTPTIVDPRTQQQHEQYETWAKENENRAVRHSLANLQQHLSLVAAQKQIQGAMYNEDLTVPPVEMQYSPIESCGQDQALMAQHRYLQSTAFSHQMQRGYREWPLQSDSSLTTTATKTTAANLASSQILQAQMQRQQISNEARQLEQRHLDSFARAMDKSALNTNSAYISANEDQYQDVARFHAAMTGGWAGLEGSVFHDGSSQRARPPTITLTEPSSLSKRMQFTSDETSHGKMAWSDEPAYFFEEALSHQAQMSWQAAIAQAATNSQMVSAGAWNQHIDASPSIQSAANRRRSSIQSMRNLTTETERVNYSGDAIQSANTLRRGSFNSCKSKKPLPGSKRKGKQRDGSLQRTIDAIQPQLTQALHCAPLLSNASTPAERQSMERQIQHQPYPPHSTNDDIILRCSTGPFNQTIIPTQPNRKQKRS